jgi:hypothetical protein
MFEYLGLGEAAPAYIDRRIQFLQLCTERREYTEHESAAAYMQRIGRIATLQRDTACLFILLEEYDQAMTHLRLSGQAWAGIGLFAGYTLLGLSRNQTWTEIYENDFRQAATLMQSLYGGCEPLNEQERDAFDRETDLTDNLGPDRTEPAIKPYLAKSVASKRQLINLVQAGVLSGSDNLNTLTDRACDYLLETPPGIMQGIQLQKYVLLLRALSHGDFGHDGREWLKLMLSNRMERIEIAQRDSYHWRRLLNPEFLIDIDLLVLCVCAIQGERATELEETMNGHPPIAVLPWTIAKRLYQR